MFSINLFSKISLLSITGDLAVEEEVLQWLITQKTEDRIELITRVMLEAFVEETQYLAVYFCKISFELATERSTIKQKIFSYLFQTSKTVTYATKY